ncbi:CapA family protein [Candidatus Nomurabacteria bacterium]|nr:CapA family protein [Candidatus Nomurabacteria bacterium]
MEEKIIPEIKKQDSVTLAFGGDIMLDRGVRNSVVKNLNNDYSLLFKNSEEIENILKNSDISFANLEGTASDKGTDKKNLYSFRMDPIIIPVLKEAGLDILSLANNHVADWGREAYIDTMSRLKENRIFYTGGGLNKKEAEAPIIFEKNGMKIGFLGFSDKGPDYMRAKNATENTPEQAGVIIARDDEFDTTIKNAAKQVDYLIVSFHFGEEYQDVHDKRQEYLAHKAVDDGAKIVIGHHPHVIEDTEIYKNSYIAYSLGNFIFDQSWSEPTMKGMLLQIKLNKDGSMDTVKNITQLNSFFQLSGITEKQEEKVLNN